MTKILFAGCSFVKGVGLEHEENDLQNCCNVFANEYFSDNYSVTNIGRGGNSNLSIYLSASLAITQQKFDYVFVGWTNYPRYNFEIGFETYEFGRRVIITPSEFLNRQTVHNGHNLSYSVDWLNDFRKKYLLVHHDHFEVIALMKYITLLNWAAEQAKTKIYFINSLCPWSLGYFDRKSSFAPSDLDPYTQQLLDVKTRDDSEIFKLYNLMHDEFEKNGGIIPQQWINLHESFADMKIDVGSDNSHPGPLSHNKFGKFLAHNFKEKY